MHSSNINPFEYVSILISIILGLGITQILSAFTDLLYDYKKVKFYWPHLLWIGFVLFLHIQDWFVTYQIRHKQSWYLPELFFVLLYPILLFAIAKMLLPTNQSEERYHMKLFYFSQFRILFFIVSLAIIVSILFNLFLLKNSIQDQLLFIPFLLVMLFVSIKDIKHEWVHQLIALILTAVSLISIFIDQENWAIK
jgi:hypothetical protein